METLVTLLGDIRPGIDYTTETALLDDGILDSFDIVTLVAEIAETFGTDIPARDITPENFNTADAIYELIQRLGE